MTKTNLELVRMFQPWCAPLPIVPPRVEAQIKPAFAALTADFRSASLRAFLFLNLLRASDLEDTEPAVLPSCACWLVLWGVCWQENEGTRSVPQRSPLGMLWFYVLIIRLRFQDGRWPRLLFLWHGLCCRALVCSPDTLTQQAQTITLTPPRSLTKHTGFSVCTAKV